MAVIIHAEQPRLAGPPASAVQFPAGIDVGIDAETYGARSEAGGDVGHQPVAPFFGELATLGARLECIARTVTP